MASPTEEERRDWSELPREVAASILSRATAVDTLTSAQFVCKSWLEASKDPLTWKIIHMFDDGDYEFNLDKIFHHAIDRSCGQTVEIKLEYFGDDDILKYITDRSKQIKRLRIEQCEISDEAVIRTVDKLPLLEELELTRCGFDAETLESIGEKCPHLKSFGLNSKVKRNRRIRPGREDKRNKEAFAIGKHMPGLRSLKLTGNSLTNKGLEAILDGCPALESLDLSKCLNIRVAGEAWERCTEKVKYLCLGRRRNWAELPREALVSIFSRMRGSDTLMNAEFVCKSWFEASKDPLAWKRIDFYEPERKSSGLDRMCRHAIDRSCGQAVDINLDYCANDELLTYIAERSSRVERLRLIQCYDVSDEGLIEALQNLPFLEDLDLTLSPHPDTETLEAIGRLCPCLKVFKLNSETHVPDYMDFDDNEYDKDAEAVAIGKYMPGLKSLQIIGNFLSNKGLGAILEGCPGLESLDLRRCRNVRLEGKVWEMCVERVKQLRLPDDSIRDYPFQNGPNSDVMESGSRAPKPWSYFDDDDDDDYDKDDDDDDDYYDDDDDYDYHYGDGDDDYDGGGGDIPVIYGFPTYGGFSSYHDFDDY